MMIINPFNLELNIMNEHTKGLIAIIILLFLGLATFFYIAIVDSNIDYKLKLNPSGTIEISDKHKNKHLIELDSLEEFIIQDNL